jgi:hypothetical protein
MVREVRVLARSLALEELSELGTDRIEGPRGHAAHEELALDEEDRQLSRHLHGKVRHGALGARFRHGDRTRLEGFVEREIASLAWPRRLLVERDDRERPDADGSAQSKRFEARGDERACHAGPPKLYAASDALIGPHRFVHTKT